MRAEFNELHLAIMKTNYGQEVVIAMEKLEQKITEFEKRIECARRSNQDSNNVIMSLVNSYQDLGKTEEELTYGDFEVLQRGVYDVDIALNFNDKEPIENNWYGLFEEPKKEEPKVIWAKGTIIEWNETVKYYSAKGGARARVTEDYTTLCETVKVEFLDDLRNGQENGGYYGYMFKDEPIIELSNGGIPYRYCHHCSIKEEETVMGQVNGFWLCCDCYDEIKDDEEINDEFVKDIIENLKAINVDGETMQYIIEQVGMSKQMLRQLIMSNPESNTNDILEEKRILNEARLDASKIS